MLKEENEITVTAGNGWYCGYLAWEGKRNFWGKEPSIIAVITITYPDKIQKIITDESWTVAKSNIIGSEIYKGETYDARIAPEFCENAILADQDKSMLISHEGEFVIEHERIKPINIFKDNNQDTIVDFGQNLVGYVEFTVDAKEGETVEYSHGEILDKDGNFYNTNLRTADQKIKYICKEGRQTYKPSFTFMGFRYIRLEKAPENIELTAVVVHSDIKRTGFFECGSQKINQLFKNIIWGQKGNFLDIPTDCPQRDERLGWTGDAQVFIRTASYNYNVEKFFEKWLNDVKADQFENGSIPHVVPNMLTYNDGSSAWGDAVVICPWQLYLTYGNKAVMEKLFENMKRWVKFSQNSNRMHFGDWLAKDAHEWHTQEIIEPRPEDRLKGRSSQHLISDAFNLYSTSLLVKIGKILGEDMTEYEKVYQERKIDFQNKYEYHTQTEHVLALYFDIAKDKEKTAAGLVDLVRKNGNRLSTGFVGTPYLLHVLSQNGYADVAYDLLLQEKFPSWLFSVNRGATTIWEHWDGIREDGSITDVGMNSYNHYAYGAVADWMYGVVCGINVDENAVAFERVILKPIVDRRLGYAQASIDTKYGKVISKWSVDGDNVKYEFTVPNKATIIIDGKNHMVEKGHYCFETPYTGR